MERYEDYKDSSIEWIGEIPSHWEIVRISSLYDQRSEKASAEDYAPLSVTMQGVVPQLDTAAKSQDTDNRKLVRNGDFVINSRSDRRGSCGIAHQDGTVSLISNVLVPKESESFSPEYYGILFKTEGFADEYYRWGTGIVDDLWSTNWSRMKNILVVAPPAMEQKAIADYLSEKTSEIDLLIKETEKSIEFLKEYRKSVISETVTKGLDSTAILKDSGIEQIGMIPDDWECRALTNLCERIFDGPFGSNLKGKDYVEEGVRVVRLENLKFLYFDDSKRSFVTKEKYQTLLNHTVYPSDVIVSTFISDEVKACRMPASIEYAVNKADCVGVRVGSRVSADFIRYFLSSNSAFAYLLRDTHGSTRSRINTGQLKQLPVCVPPKSIQSEIVDYLNRFCDVILALIESKQKLIEELVSYRKSLISEAVTGKFKVPGVE